MYATVSPTGLNPYPTMQLGVNIDHICTLRNARGGVYPCPIEAARIAEAYGADGITVHLREDRRHMKDHDIYALRTSVRTRLNLEMANTEAMVAIACEVKPDMVTLVPEKREEITTEGGLDVRRYQEALRPSIERLHQAGIKVSLFIDPEAEQIRASHAVGAEWIELHTGQYAESHHPHSLQPTVHTPATLQALIDATALAQSLGVYVNAGHGLNYKNVTALVQAVPTLVELNIGHAIIAESLLVGLGPAVSTMKTLMNTTSMLASVVAQNV
ncbi:MAG: pyridoxine 5'-phosphate synthase [Vampirovibrionales bacterium]